MESSAILLLFFPSRAETVERKNGGNFLALEALQKKSLNMLLYETTDIEQL